MPATTFRELYEDAAMDPYKGTYDNVLSEFAIIGNDWDAMELFAATLAMEPDLANAYVGIFEDAAHPTGTTRLLHAPRWYPTRLGQSSPYDHRAYALLDDVTRGTVQTVVYNASLFESTSEVYIPLDGQDAWEMWTNDAQLELLPVLRALAERQQVRVPKMMYVPPKYTTLFIGKRLTPRQVFETVYPVLAADDQPLSTNSFINWMMVCGMSSGKGKKASLCLLPDVRPTLANERFLEWTQDFVDRMLTPSQTTAYRQPTQRSDSSHDTRTTRPTAAT
jgi:TorA maturation chaperone TorD